MALKTQGHWVSKKAPKIPVSGPKLSYGKPAPDPLEVSLTADTSDFDAYISKLIQPPAYTYPTTYAPTASWQTFNDSYVGVATTTKWNTGEVEVVFNVGAQTVGAKISTQVAPELPPEQVAKLIAQAAAAQIAEKMEAAVLDLLKPKPAPSATLTVNLSDLYPSFGFKPAKSSTNPILETLEKYVPGLGQMTAPKCPDGSLGSCFQYKDARLVATIVHLNDQHKWSREQIADWVETLDLDLTFKFDTAEEVNDEQPANQS